MIISRKGGPFNIYVPGKIVRRSFWVTAVLNTASAATQAPSKVLMDKSLEVYELIHKEREMGVKVINKLA